MKSWKRISAAGTTKSTYCCRLSQEYCRRDDLQSAGGTHDYVALYHLESEVLPTLRLGQEAIITPWSSKDQDLILEIIFQVCWQNDMNAV